MPGVIFDGVPVNLDHGFLDRVQAELRRQVQRAVIDCGVRNEILEPRTVRLELRFEPQPHRLAIKAELVRCATTFPAVPQVGDESTGSRRTGGLSDD